MSLTSLVNPWSTFRCAIRTIIWSIHLLFLNLWSVSNYMINSSPFRFFCCWSRIFGEITKTWAFGQIQKDLGLRIFPRICVYVDGLNRRHSAGFWICHIVFQILSLIAREVASVTRLGIEVCMLSIYKSVYKPIGLWRGWYLTGGNRSWWRELL